MNQANRKTEVEPAFNGLSGLANGGAPGSTGDSPRAAASGVLAITPVSGHGDDSVRDGPKSSSGIRPKLLFLAWPFPPVNMIGAVRTWNIAKHLSRIGWEVTVVTPHQGFWRSVEGVETFEKKLKEEGIKRMQTGHRWRYLLPAEMKCADQGFGWFAGRVQRKLAWRFGIDPHTGWVSQAAKACVQLTPDDVDIILASGPPFASFRVAKRLSDRLGRPYVLDYRDPWSGNPHELRDGDGVTVREERALLAGCQAVTIVSPSWADAMASQFCLGSKIHIVTNGYDSEDMAAVRPLDFGHFAIVYTGSFYPPKRVITPVMAACQRLDTMIKSPTREWRFHYYGDDIIPVREAAEAHGIREKVVLHGNVPRGEALAAVRGAEVAVVITSVSEDCSLADRGIVTGKLFEALGLGTPVLLVAPRGSDAELIGASAGSVHCFTGTDIEGIARFLAEAASGRKPDNGSTEICAWPNIVKGLDTLLRDSISNGTHCGSPG
jgi:glycosyltransferase involved in cell wall biosynthesis